MAPGIPQDPGIYKYFDSSGELLYVGKAKNLRKRVSSYFSKTLTSYKTHELVQRIARIEFTIVDSEQDAFLLENALIKQFQPRFNINLKDDKSYPFIVIKNEPFPRVFLTRRRIPDGSEYLGPFTSVGKVRELLEFIRQTVPLRTCSLNLTARNIERGRFKVCLEYHLGNCKGPCEGFQTAEDYAESLQQVRHLLKGNLAPVIQHFRAEMKREAENMAFEKAELIRRKIDFLENYRARSVIVNARLGDVDVFSLVREADLAYVNYLMVRNGTIVQTQTIRLQTHLDEPEEEVLGFAVASLRSTFNSEAPEIVVPFPMDYAPDGVTVTHPKAGDRRKLLDLSLKNANHYIEEVRDKARLQLQPATRPAERQVLRELQEALQLQELPVHIECFDNSNFQGSYPVSAMVCFRNGIPSKADYRHFNVRTVEGINDFATMKEAVYRRYKRLDQEGQPFPQLVIIDGGKGQLHAAAEAMQELGLSGRTTLVGLAKNEEELFFLGDQQSLKLPYNSPALHLVRRIRDEVHRFGITFHRKKRSQGTFHNELEDIPGIGKSTADRLLQTFRSIARIRQQPEEALAAVVGKAKAALIFSYWHPEEKKQERD
ncbi:MAG TPA: excinuclease ABC subunit UvrC [Chitinophagaceae bacterium]|nr:excinuclease ABC subunit UvrC [Chitinophagaceae bacterium]